MKLEALDHPKTLDFASRLDVSIPTAIGHLELLWAFTGKKAPQGNIGKWPDGAIARACYWNGPADVFVSALVDAGFVDDDGEHRLVVHDWQDHAPGWVRAKLVKVKLPFVKAETTKDASSEPSSDGSSDGSSEPSIQGKGSTREESVSAAKPPRRVRKGSDDPDWLAEFKAAYPQRSGDPNWRGAVRAGLARLREGHTVEQFLDGARRYAAFIRATGKERTEYVQQASRFLGPGKPFMEPWTLPTPKSVPGAVQTGIHAGWAMR